MVHLDSAIRTVARLQCGFGNEIGTRGTPHSIHLARRLIIVESLPQQRIVQRKSEILPFGHYECIDANHQTFRREQRPARIARIDGGVGLYVSQSVHIARRLGDYAVGIGIFETQWMTNSKYRVAVVDLVAVKSQLQRADCKSVGLLHKGEVVQRVGVQDVGNALFECFCRQYHLTAALHDVPVGNYQFVVAQ